ncbi:MAG: hypothetical protein V1776_05100 [Candidatus Diapherotrites archaeon]
MKDIAGNPPRIFWKYFMFYLAIQILIWIKVGIFYFWFGYGISYYAQPLLWDAPFVAVPAFGNLFHVWEFFFHQIMHVLIAVWVFLLAKHANKMDWGELAGLFFGVVILHNVGYWFTFAHPTILFSVSDFLTDYVSLWVFFLVFSFFLHLYPRAKKWTVPWLE